MPSSRASHSAPRGRKGPAFVAGLVAGWLLVAAYLLLVAHNAGWLPGESAPAGGVTLTQLLGIPGLPVDPQFASLVAESLAALTAALTLILLPLTFAPLPTPEKPPTPPIASTPAPTPPTPTPTPARQPTPAQPSASARPMFTPWVFISHSSRDDAFGKRLAADLRAALTPDQADRVWYDSAPERGEEIPPGADDTAGDGDIARTGGLVAGQNFPREIVAQIAMRNVVVVILSPEAARSRWVRYEIDQAITRYNGPERFAIYPVIASACALPQPLAIFQALDFTRAEADPVDYARLLGDLVARIGEGRVDLSESAPPFDLGLLPEPPRLIGRDDDLDWALDRLRAGETTGVTALRGMGGIGKSALAAIAIRRLRQERAFPDGIAVVLCENQTDPVELLRQALSRFAPGRRAPEANDLPALAAVAQQALAGKRALITLDNIEPDWPIEQVTGPLTAAGATLLLTARQMLPGAAVPVEGVRRLDLLAPDDALLLFAQSYGRADANALTGEEREAATRIVSLLDRHTLAVRLAGAYAAELGRPLPRVAEEIASDVLRIPEGETPRKVEAVLARSVGALPPDGQRLFAALAAVATGEFGRQAALALARGLALANPDASVDLLVRRALLDSALDATLPASADAERLRLHPLLQAEAAHRYAGWPAADQQTAQATLAAWYADYTNEVASSSRTGYLALTPDEANIIGALDWALAHGDDRAAARICDGIRGFWRDTGRTRAGLRWLQVGAQAAERIAERTGEQEDRLIQAHITGYLGDILQNTGRLDEAEAIFQQDLTLRQSLNDRQGEGVVLSRLGSLALRRGQLEAAADFFQQSLLILRETQDRQGEGADLSNLGQVALQRGQLEAAADFFQQSLLIDRETQDRQGEGVDLYCLALIAEAREDFDTSERLHRESLELSVETQQGADIATSLEVLGAFLIEHRRGKPGEGCEMLAQAAALWDEMTLTENAEQARETARELGCGG